MPDRKDVVLNAEGGMFGLVTMKAEMITRTNLAMPHLCGAARFSRRVADVEKQVLGDDWGPHWDELRDNATAAIFLAASSLESYANELFADRDKIFPGQKRVLDIFWNEFEKKSTLSKLDLALALREKPRLDRRAPLYKSLDALLLLRNELIHFKPEWSNEVQKHKTVSDALKGQFTPNTFMKDELIFPRSWIGHSCTSWAIKTVLAVFQDFEKGAGLAGRTNEAAWGSQLTP